MQDDNILLKLSDSVTYQKMSDDGETVILELSSGILFTCNDTTRDFLEAIGKGSTMSRILDSLMEIYDIDRDTLEADLNLISERLLEKGIIERKTAT